MKTSTPYDNTTPRITLEPVERRVTLRHAGHVIAMSHAVLCLLEHGYPPRYYWPRAALTGARLTRSATRTHCPFKGEATYHHIDINGVVVTDAAWSYERPIDAMTPIAGRVAFLHQALTIA